MLGIDLSLKLVNFYGVLWVLQCNIENSGSDSRKWNDKMFCANKSPEKGLMPIHLFRS